MSEFEFKVIVYKDSITALAPNGIAKPGGKVKENALTRETIRIFKDWLNKGKLSQFDEFELLGKYLYEAIFSDLGDLFKNSYKKAQEERKPLVVQLGFEVDDRLADWPWEYLYSPDEKGFLVTDLGLVVSRYVSHNEESKRPQLNSPLRVLVVTSCLDQHLTGARQIYQKIQGLVNDGISIDSHIRELLTFNTFFDELNKLKPHVVHFIGYSRLKDNGKETEIGLFNGNDEKSIHWMSDGEFISLWVNRDKTKMPPLVFLHLWKTSNYDIARIAFKLSKEAGIPVVATHQPIDDTVAKDFCRAFYRKLAEGQSIPAAVQDGRKQICDHARLSKAYRDFGAIVLYTRNADVSIFRSAKKRRNTAQM